MASIVFSNFNDFVQRCKETVVSNINWEAMILKVLSGNSGFMVNQVALTDNSQREANSCTLSETTTSSFETSLSHTTEENLDEKFEARLCDIKYHQIDVPSTIDERGEEAEVQEKSHNYYHSSQSLIRNVEIRPLVQEEEEEEQPFEQLNNSLHWDFQSSQIENEGHAVNLEEYSSVSMMEDISYVVPDMEICEKDPIGEESTAMQLSLSNMKVQIRRLTQATLDGFISDHSVVNAERQDHKDCAPDKPVKKRLRRRAWSSKKGHLKDKMGTWSKKSMKKRKIGEVVQADMNKAPRKKLRVNFTDDEKTRKVPPVEQRGPYVLIPRLSKVDVLRTVRLLRQRTIRSLNLDKPSSSSKESYRCNICHQLLKNKHGLLRHHIYRHTDEKPYKCPHCPKSFKNYGDVKQHTRRVHTIDGSYNTTPNRSLRVNFTGENNRKVSQVEEAGSCLPISYPSEEFDPLETARSLRPRNCISPNCADSTVASSKKPHVQTGDSSKNHWTDRRGRKRVSLVSKGKKCTRKVEKTKRQKNELALELENVTCNSIGSSSEKRYYCCDICHQWLKHKKSLYRHIIYQHTDESKPFECPHCPRSYTDSTALKKHIRNSKSCANDS